ncbi:Coenzyme F420 hydrogenase/dehydrogenase, beta subunit C-terminal domain [Phenylobacterium sp. LjRoot219]|uniref:Coenzyme F420 hydrogenase/dehydrogenase, beta subunit C-terminal domain n=1 Tax=Phenylobacterium sp. LjRoot219 TaxID=3342283 RepID=UPI003ECD7E9E
MRLDAYGQLRPSGPRGWYARRTEAFARTCPFSAAALNEDLLAAALFPAAPRRDARIGRHIAAYVGWAAAGDFRAAGSSGGLVSWAAAALLQEGLVDAVAHVGGTDDGADKLFRYQISRSVDEVRRAAKSRYYPVELSGVLQEIRAVPGRYAVIGVPCFIKAVRLACAEDPLLRGRVAFTLGLFCGHMKSARMAESHAWQMGLRAADIASIDFRAKDPARPANWYTTRIGLRDGGERRRDWWHMADGDWGAGFFQASACDACDDVVAETADVSFGDAWVEPYASDGRGTNVVVVRSPQIAELLERAAAAAALALSPVDAEFVVRTQAAGFRQRREGLALRLAHWRAAPRKRVAPAARGVPPRRQAIYGLRCAIARWSHRVFWLARRLRCPWLYLSWARAALRTYQALTYSRGRLGAAIDRLAKPGQA